MSVSVEEQDQLSMTPEELQRPPVPEVELETKVIAFEDERGIERRPHPDAVECYASPEIQQLVGEHFLDVDRGLDEVEAEIAEIMDPDKVQEGSFRPLDDDFLDRLKAKVKEQLPGLTEKTTELQHREVTTGRFIKRTKMIAEEVEVEEPVTGFVVEPTDKDQVEGWRGVHEQAKWRAKYMGVEHVAGFEQTTVNKLEELLVSDKQLWNKAAKRLPLLTSRIRDAGLTDEQIDGLDWQQVESLVPEAQDWFTDVHTLEESIDSKVLEASLRDVERKLVQLGPDARGTISTIYYDEPTLTRISDLQEKVGSTLAANYEAVNPGETYGFEEGAAMRIMRAQIAHFFDLKPLADTLLMHGTISIPRIIKSGALRPAGGMDPEEYTFNTRRSHIPGVAAGIDGSRATHFADHASGNYATNMQLTEGAIREHIARPLGVPLDHPWVDAEIAKGGFGESVIAVRLGDIIAQSPYGGNRDVDLDSEKRSARPELRRGIVELTPTGWEKAQSKLSTEHGEDVAYLAAPRTRTEQEMYDYGYPLDDLLLGIPSKDPETIPNALREIGWSEEQIAQHTFGFTKEGDREGAVLQDWAVRNPKYAHRVVVPMSIDS